VGGLVEGETIHVQVGQFSIYCPVYGPFALRPLAFENDGPHNARVSVWTFEPAFPGAAARPGGGWVCRAPGPPLAVDRTVCRMLPVGKYSFCVEYREDGERWHYILKWRGGLGDHAPNDCAYAEKLRFGTDLANPTPGRCGDPPTPTPAVVATEAPTPSGPTPTPGPLQTGGEGVIITLKPGQPYYLRADGRSQLVLLVDVNPLAPCWQGRDVLSGTLDVYAETTLGTTTWPNLVYPDELPAEVGLQAGTSPGLAVVTVRVTWCPKEGVMVYGVCSAPDAQGIRCEGQATIAIQ
jgi:hypothetical protein